MVPVTVNYEHNYLMIKGIKIVTLLIVDGWEAYGYRCLWGAYRELPIPLLGQVSMVCCGQKKFGLAMPDYLECAYYPSCTVFLCFYVYSPLYNSHVILPLIFLFFIPIFL